MDLYSELSAYTLTHSDPTFIHQYVSDAHALQTADESTKPIRITFALVGLYLYLVHGYSGKEVQKAHTQIAKKKLVWPKFILPKNRGAISVADVMASSIGKERDDLIKAWCSSVWESYAESHQKVAEFVGEYYFNK